MKTKDEFVVGKHNIDWVSNLDCLPKTFEPVEAMPTYQLLPRTMTDAEIERELQPRLCTLGDVLYFLEHAPQECRDDYCNIFYTASCVVYVRWHADYGEGYVGTWRRGDGAWGRGHRVLSSATDTEKLGNGHSDSMSLASLEARITKLEAWRGQISIAISGKE